MIQRFQDYLTLENNQIKVMYTFKDQIFKTTLIENKNNGEILKFEDSNEFEIVFQNGLIINKHHLTLEKYGATNSKVRFYFKESKGVQINYVIKIEEDKNYFYSNLEINIHPDLVEEYIIDRIDFISLSLVNDVNDHNPIQFETLTEEEFYLHLGQPLYLNSFFMANEFPITQNKYQSSKIVFRRYLGKSLIESNINDYNVFGVSRLNQYSSLQNAFYTYLQDIKIKSIPYFNYQVAVENNYEEILNHFNHMNHILSQKEFPIISCLTLKNWYNPKSKFEENDVNQLYFLNENLIKNGSHLGVHLSLTDGLDQDYLERNQLGSINRSMINISDNRYLDLLKQKLVYYLKTYSLAFIELELLFTNPLQFKGEHFLGGGYKNLYSYNDAYEKYIELFKELRKIKKGLRIHIAVSSLSPFFLKYVNGLQAISESSQLQIPIQNVYQNEIVDLNRAQYYFKYAQGKEINTLNKVDDATIEVLKWYTENYRLLSTAISINENEIVGYYAEKEGAKVIALQNISNQIQNFSSDFTQDEHWIDVLNAKYIQEIQLNPHEILILENRIHTPLKIEKIKLLEGKGKIYLNQSLIGKPNIYFNNEKIDYTFNPILNQIDFNIQNYKEINEIVINDSSGTKIEYKKFYPNSVLFNQNKNYEFEVGLVNRFDFSVQFDVEIDTFNRILVKQKNNLEIKINSEGYIEFIIKEVKVILPDFKVVIPQKFNLRIDKCYNDSVIFYVDGQLKQVISLPNLHKIAFTSEKLLLADIVDNFALKEI